MHAALVAHTVWGVLLEPAHTTSVIYVIVNIPGTCTCFTFSIKNAHKCIAP